MPASLRPVQQNLFGDGGSAKKASSGGSASAGGAKNSAHIEVCARIRPLQISMQSSSSYFGGGASAKDGAGSPRKPGIPPPGSSKKSAANAAASAAANSGDEELFYAWDVVGDDTASQSTKTDIVQGRTHQYTLDKVYGPTSTTREVYNQSVKGLVNSAMEGYHSAVLAYGQTSTGKTFSMTGTPSSPGIVPLAIHQCFQCLEKNREYLIRVSYLEVYKEQIRDLLAEGASQIRLFDHREQGLVIKGLREEVVTCPKQIFEILAQGEKRRKIGATNMNQHSSRSHVMVRLWIESRAVGGEPSMQRKNSSGSMSSTKGTPVRVSSLSLVDLAGSESVKLHGADEARRQEGHYINKSLMALGKVVYALSEQGKLKNGKVATAPQHIPYRDSKLTRLLQPSLSGNAQMVLLCCVSPVAKHIEESHNTFKFAARAKKVPQKATIQESVDEKTLLQTYREEIEALKQQLSDAKKQQVTLLEDHETQQAAAEPASVELSIVEEEDMDDEVQELKLAIRNMEHLILKSKVSSPPSVPATTTDMSQDELLDAVLYDSDEDDDDDDDDDAALLALMTETQKSSGAIRSPAPMSPTRTPTKGTDDNSGDMHKELNRIQGLLGSVLKKRTRGVKSPAINGMDPAGLASLSENGSNPKNTAELNKLRLQLEEQEATSTLRQADSSFLQKQLDEKDSLLAEVSKILEQVEQRQVELEAQNARLKAEVELLKSHQRLKPSSPITRSPDGQLEV